MPNPLTSSAFVRLLDKRLSDVTDGVRKDKELSSMIPQIYNMVKTDSAWEEYYSVGAVPDIPEFTGKISYLPRHPGYYTKIEPKEYAAGIQVQRKLMDDKKYDVLDNNAEGLMQAAMRTKEKLGVRPFAFAFSTAFDFMESEEGIALCGSHTTKSGTSTTNGFSNSGTSPLSKTSVYSTRLNMRQFRNDISERLEISDNLALIVPDNLVDTAMEIVQTPKGLDTAEGNINPQAGRYKIIPYLRLDDFDTDNWFMVDLDAMKRDLLWLDRIPVEAKNTVDFETYLLKMAVYFRVAYGWRDWRFIYGHNVS